MNQNTIQSILVALGMFASFGQAAQKGAFGSTVAGYATHFGTGLDKAQTILGQVETYVNTAQKIVGQVKLAMPAPAPTFPIVNLVKGG